MSPLESIQSCAFTKVCNWHDRATRSEFWWFTLFTVIIEGLMAVVLAIPFVGVFLYSLISLYLAWALFMVHIRRLHDNDKSAWWLLYLCTPCVVFFTTFYLANYMKGIALFIIGLLALLVSLGTSFYYLYLLISRGTEGRNLYGPDPLQVKIQKFNNTFFYH